jgi:hypothetical protein
MEETDRDYDCSYYGSLEEVKPTYGVNYMLLDEYIARSVEKQKDIFKTKMVAAFEVFTNKSTKMLRDNKSALKKINEKLDGNKKLINNIAKLNNLEVPKLLKKE